MGDAGGSGIGGAPDGLVYPASKDDYEDAESGWEQYYDGDGRGMHNADLVGFDFLQALLLRWEFTRSD